MTINCSLHRRYNRQFLCFIRSISLFLSISLLFSTAGINWDKPVYAVPASKKKLPQKVMPSEKKQSIHDISVPGMKVGDSFRGKEDTEVVLIRDLHCQDEAQCCIATCIQDLYAQLGIRTILLEGAEGTVQTTLYKAFPDEKVRKQVGREFVKKGYLTGAEYADIQMGVAGGIELFGVEDAKVYIDNFKAFREVRDLYGEAKGTIDEVNNWFETVKKERYSEDLQVVDGVSQMLEGRKELKLAQAIDDVGKVLVKQGKSKEDPFEGYGELEKFRQIMAVGATIDQQKVQSELKKLVGKLEGVLVEEELQELVTKMLHFRLRKISAAVYLGFLKQLYEENEIGEGTLSETYPELGKWLSLSLLQEDLVFENVWKEMQELVEGLKETYARKEGVEAIAAVDGKWLLLEKLMKLELTRDHLETLKKDDVRKALESVFQQMGSIGANQGEVNAPVVKDDLFDLVTINPHLR